MKRIVKNLESLEVVRLKCTKRQTDFTKEELRHLNLVNIELQKSFGKKYVRPLDESCPYCKITAMNSVHNYIMFEESKVENNTVIPVTHIEVDGDIMPLPDGDFTDVIQEASNDDQLSLKELRVKYPHIKARSVARFLELLNEHK